MFRENEAFSDCVSELVKACAKKQRGQVIAHEEIERILKCRRGQGWWPAAIDKMKRRVESELGITLYSVRGVGYELLTLADQFDKAPRARLTRAHRQIHKGIKHLDAPIGTEIPEHLAKKKAFMRNGLVRRKSEIHGETIRQGIFAKKNPPEPRVPFFRAS